MALEINSQFDFFKNVKLDDDGNLLVSITNGLTGDYLPLSGGTVTGDTTFTAGLTANSLSSTSILWSKVDGVIYTKDSDTSGAGNTNGISHGSTLTMSNSTNSAIVASNTGDIRRSTNSSVVGSNASSVFNTQRSSVIASDASVIGEDIGTSTGQRNSIIASETSSILNAGLAAYYGVYNTAIIGSENSDIRATNAIGETTERIVLLGMKDYITNAQGVHIENLYITSGASAGKVWTSVGTDGRGEWADTLTGDFLPLTGGTMSGLTFYYLDCKASTTVTPDFILDGGSGATIAFEVNINGGIVGGASEPDGHHPYKVDLLSSGTAYTFSGEINVLSISTLTADTTVTLPAIPSKDFYVVKDKTGNAGTYPISIGAGGTLINGASSYIINLNTKPSITFLYDGEEYITI